MCRKKRDQIILIPPREEGGHRKGKISSREGTVPPLQKGGTEVRISIGRSQKRENKKQQLSDD